MYGASAPSCPTKVPQKFDQQRRHGKIHYSHPVVYLYIYIYMCMFIYVFHWGEGTALGGRDCGMMEVIILEDCDGLMLSCLAQLRSSGLVSHCI